MARVDCHIKCYVIKSVCNYEYFRLFRSTWPRFDRDFRLPRLLLWRFFSSGMWHLVPRYRFFGIFVNLTFSITSADEVMMEPVGSSVTPVKSTALNDVTSWKTVIFEFWLPCRISSKQLEMSYGENKWTVVDIVLHLKIASLTALSQLLYSCWLNTSLSTIESIRCIFFRVCFVFAVSGSAEV